MRITLPALIALGAILLAAPVMADDINYVGSGQTTSIRPSFGGASPDCLQVYDGCGADIMVPAGNQSEWSSFYNSVYNGSYNNGNVCAGLSSCAQNCGGGTVVFLPGIEGGISVGFGGISAGQTINVQFTGYAAGSSGFLGMGNEQFGASTIWANVICNNDGSKSLTGTNVMNGASCGGQTCTVNGLPAVSLR